MSHALTKLLQRPFGHAHAEDEESKRFAIQAEQAYRTMAGLDEPIEDMAKRARHNSDHASFTTKRW